MPKTETGAWWADIQDVRDSIELRREQEARRADGPRPLAAPPRRRTVEITGRTVGAPSLPRLVDIDRRRPARRAVERVGPRPDRLALWAVVLGAFLILVAATSASHAATVAPSRAVPGAAPQTRHAHAPRPLVAPAATPSDR
jgi:hypothetical protein